MDTDSLLNAPRWKILECIAKKPSSPSEIAEHLGTSVAYISQQLKLLEAASLVIKERTGSVQKGEPRTLFSIAKEMIYITALMKGTPHKTSVRLTEHHKITLNIWSIENNFLHKSLEKFCWGIEREIKHVPAIFVDLNNSRPHLMIFLDDKKIKTLIEKTYRETSSEIFEISFLPSNSVLNSQIERWHAIYDPSRFQNEKKLKGGKSP